MPGRFFNHIFRWPTRSDAWLGSNSANFNKMITSLHRKVRIIQLIMLQVATSPSPCPKVDSFSAFWLHWPRIITSPRRDITFITEFLRKNGDHLSTYIR
ncbi:hypothetical protein QR680_018763 [Steinernema hermaphroditum]|uniref:Uncharacterized protein n=1 Tax=Steinernema hermaphroditum TaxID=289476 RepID=A0AA39LQU5_9BILA|nr:hypothetical protein QR680_018763 [Steinernema hermaphroditum]